MLKRLFAALVITTMTTCSTIGCGSDNSQSIPAPSQSESASSQTTQAPPQSKPEPPKPKSEKKAKTLQQQALEDPDATIGQKNALKKAIMYATRSHMSKAKLYNQLTSEYGEKFPPEDAQWAIEHLSDIDWKANALEKAKMYQSKQAMSAERIRDQLSSAYGEEFEPEEVEYAIENLPK